MNRKFFIVDRNLNTTYSPIEIEGKFCVPMEAIEEMKKHCSYDEAIAYILNISIQNQEQEERKNKAIKKLDELNEKLKCMFNVKINNAEVSEIKRILKGE